MFRSLSFHLEYEVDFVLCFIGFESFNSFFLSFKTEKNMSINDELKKRERSQKVLFL